MKNHSSNHAFCCAQCRIEFKLKKDLIKHCEMAHDGIVTMQEGELLGIEQSTADKQDDADELEEVEEQSPTPVIQYILESSENISEGTNENTQYTVVNISDVSAFQNAHTVIEEPKTTILSSTLNDDGTTTLMVATEPGMEEVMDENKTVVFLRIPDDNEQD